METQDNRLYNTLDKIESRLGSLTVTTAEQGIRLDNITEKLVTLDKETVKTETILHLIKDSIDKQNLVSKKSCEATVERLPETIRQTIVEDNTKNINKTNKIITLLKNLTWLVGGTGGLVLLVKSILEKV